MSLYSVGQTVWAGKRMVTEASGDHPAFHHCNAGDKLYVLEVRPESDMPYIVALNEDGLYPFHCSGKELMGQEPFRSNLPSPPSGGTGWGIWA